MKAAACADQWPHAHSQGRAHKINRVAKLQFLLHVFTEPDVHSVPTNMCKNAHEATLLMLAGRNSRLFVTARYHTLTFGLGKITCEVIMNIYVFSYEYTEASVASA